MNTKESTGHGKAEGKAAQKPRPKRNLTEALYAGDERFKSIFDESPIGIEFYDADGRLMDANPACLRMFGVADIAQVKGFKLFEDPNLPDEAKAKLRRCKTVRYEAPFDFEKVKELRLYETAKSGIVHLDVLITPVGVKRKAAPQGYLIQVQDITEQVRAEEEIKQRNQELTSLNRASQAITSSLDIQKVMDQIVDLTGSLVNAAYTSIVLIEEDGSLGISAESFQEVSPLGSRARPQGITRQIIASQQPLVFDDVSNDGTHNPAVVAAGVRSYAGLPVSVKGKVLGVLFVHSHTPGAFHDRLPLLTTFANQAAAAIENARLYTSLGNEKQRLELLYNLSRHLTESLDPYQVATTALDHICTALGAFKGVIYVPRPDMDRWELLATVGMKPIELETFNQVAGVPLTSGLTGWAASHKKTAVAPDVAKDKRWLTIPGLDDWVRSAMATPLLAGDTIVGVLNLLSDQIAAFREEDVEIVKAVLHPSRLPCRTRACTRPSSDALSASLQSRNSALKSQPCTKPAQY